MVGIILYAKRVSRCVEENIIEDLKSGNLSYTIVREFLSNLKEEFSRGDNEIIKVEKLRRWNKERRQWKSLFKS